jgi:hypothetical protein
MTTDEELSVSSMDNSQGTEEDVSEEETVPDDDDSIDLLNEHFLDMEIGPAPAPKTPPKPKNNMVLPRRSPGNRSMQSSNQEIGPFQEWLDKVPAKA